jgi:hypothetical protein
MKDRILLNGQMVSSLEEPVFLEIYTRCPKKWLLVDLETGQEYRGLEEPTQYGVWERVKDAKSKEI